MPNMWTTSGEREIPPEMEAERRRLEAGLAAIDAVSDEDACHVCASREELTEEHTPSKRAGNPPRIVRASIDYERTVEQGALVWMTKLIQGGAKMRTLCEKCNTTIGRWYNPAYVRLVRRCESLAVPENVGQVLYATIGHPQRVAKRLDKLKL